MINAVPRFAIEDSGTSLYDYLQKRSIAIGGEFTDANGTWDTARVAELIRAGKSIESAFTRLVVSVPAQADKVEQANVDFAKEPIGEQSVESESLGEPQAAETSETDSAGDAVAQ